MKGDSLSEIKTPVRYKSMLIVRESFSKQHNESAIKFFSRTWTSICILIFQARKSLDHRPLPHGNFCTSRIGANKNTCQKSMD